MINELYKDLTIYSKIRKYHVIILLALEKFVETLFNKKSSTIIKSFNYS